MRKSPVQQLPEVKQQKAVLFFLTFAAVVLAATATGKAMMLIKGNRLLDMVDPVITLLSRRHVILAAIVVEISCLLYVLRWMCSDGVKALATVLWLSSVFGVYRLGIWLGNPNMGVPCPCLGSLTDSLGLDPQKADSVSLALLATLWLGSALLLFKLLSARSTNQAVFGKISGKLTAVLGGALLSMNDLAPVSHAQDFEIRGSLLHRYLTNGVQSTSSTRAFTVESAGERARIRVYNLPAADVLYFEYTTDGTNAYNFEEYATNKTHHHVADPKTGTTRLTESAFRGNTAGLSIGSNLAPDWSTGFITPIWLAFSSRRFFSEPEGDVTMPPFHPLGENVRARQMFHASNKEVRTTWRKHEAEPFFLAEANIHRDGAVYRDQTMLKKESAPPELRNNDVLYSFRVTAWTNVSQWAIPLSFKAVRHNLGSPSAGGRPVRFNTLILEGMVTDIKLDTLVENLAVSLPAHTRVVDERVSLSGTLQKGVPYMTTNGTLLSVAEVKETDRYKIQLRRQPSERPLTILLPFVLLLIGWPALILVRQYIKQKGNQK